MPTVSTGRGTGTRKVKKAKAWAGSKYAKAQAKKNVVLIQCVNNK